MATTSPISEEQFERFCKDADLKTPSVAADDLRAYHVPDPVVEALVERYESYVGKVRELDVPRYMQEGSRITWYTGPRPTDRYWPALLDKLHYIDADGKVQLDASTTRIVSLLDHPATIDFQTKGLVVGHVQSGKTTNYTGVIAKGADRGYRLVIVLSGVHNQLRRQTQERLEDQLWRPSKGDWHLLTEAAKDFHPPSPAPAYFSRRSGQGVLCVVKKNARILRKLITWLNSASKELQHIPALIIDDEADQATVATKTINPLLLELLAALPRAAYVGYTATPFANLLINPASGNLYPEHFIVDLPKPPDHQGPEVIFGRDPLDGEDPEDVPDGYDMIRIVPKEEVPFVRPMSKDEIDGFSPQIAGEIRRAVLYFWLATAARRVRGHAGKHSTMLVHTSLNVAVHESFKPVLQALQQSVAAALADRDENLLDELAKQWARESKRVAASEFGEDSFRFDDLVGHLPDVVASCRVILDNSRSEDRLDYSGEPVVAIAVGGNTLSRGLTLEGLVVSYFVRAATAYDTLLQMGRWFGYRPGYGDLPRIWMTEELRDWFRFLAGVEAEIRQDIERYMLDDITPLTFAVRIPDHPAMSITAAAKMRDAKQVAAAYGGMRIQTRYFPLADSDWHDRNDRAARRLIEAIGGTAEAEPREASYVWWKVDAADVLAFLDAYEMHEKSPDRDTSLIRQYVEKRNAKGSLRNWNVAVIGSSTSKLEPYDLGEGVAVPKGIRGRYPDSSPADIKTLMSLRDAAIDLDAPDGRLTENDVRELRTEQLPDTALLAIYPLDHAARPKRESRKPLGTAKDVLGVGIVFPQPPIGKDDKVYFSADLSQVAISDDYLEEDDLSLLEDEQE